MLSRPAMIRLALLLSLVGSGGPSRTVLAQSSADAVRSRLLGQPLYLRGAWQDDTLSFDPAGKPQQAYKTGSFTTSGIDVQSIDLKGTDLRITGQRMVLEFGKTGETTRVPYRAQKYEGLIQIDVDLPPGTDPGPALDAIFAASLADLAPSLPAYWQGYARMHFLPPSAPVKMVMGKGTGNAGDPVKPPRVIKETYADCSPAARALKYSGVVQVYFTVEKDGTVSHLIIYKPAGAGLDEQAVASVQTYTFAPATQGGLPVKVMLHVDVNFQVF